MATFTNMVTLERQTEGCVKKRSEKVKVGGKYIIRPKGAYQTHNTFYRQLSFTAGSIKKFTFLFVSFPHALNSNLEKELIVVFISELLYLSF